MSRNLKALGLAMVAALALSGVAASAAQAAIHHVTVPSAPAVVTASEEETTSVFKITGGANEVHCKSTYEGTLPVVTNTSITVTPTYSECTLDGSSAPEPKVTVNHCAYVFESDTNVAGHAGVEVECAAGVDNDITITYKVFGVTCTVHVTPGTYRGVHYTGTTNATTGKKDITVNATVTGIKYHETHPAFSLCPADKTGEDGELTGIFTAQGFKHVTGCTALTETAKTTPSATYFNECEGAVQDLELNEGVT